MMSIKWLAEKIFIPKSDHRFKFKANEGYLVRLEQKMKEKGITILEKTEKSIRFRCKDTQVGGWWRIGVHKIEVIAIETKENLYDITIRFLGVKNLGILFTVVLWVAVIYKIISQDYSNLVVLMPVAIIFPHLINWQAILLIAWKIELWLGAPGLINKN